MGCEIQKNSSILSLRTVVTYPNGARIILWHKNKSRYFEVKAEGKHL